MQWTFFFTPSYTKILNLVVVGVSRQALVLMTCQGRGCPFARRVATVPQKAGCAAKAKKKCPAPGKVSLTRAFGKHHLAPGTRFTVAIVRSGWVGKFYRFTVRPKKGPRVEIACLAPGATRPGGAC
jgi:hypothetical protein